MKRSIGKLLLFVLASLWLALPSLADEPVCYVCAEFARCKEFNEPNFSEQMCERCCYHYGGVETCICRTFGGYCIQPPGEEPTAGPGLETESPSVSETLLVVDSRLIEQLTEIVGPDIGLLFDSAGMGKYLGATRGNAAATTPEGRPIHLFRFESSIRMTPRGGLRTQIELEDSRIRSIYLAIEPGGQRGGLDLVMGDGSQRHYDLD